MFFLLQNWRAGGQNRFCLEACVCVHGWGGWDCHWKIPTPRQIVKTLNTQKQERILKAERSNKSFTKLNPSEQ
jgi:hypothetical protein